MNFNRLKFKVETHRTMYAIELYFFFYEFYIPKLEPLKREYSWGQVQMESLIPFIKASNFVTRLSSV